MRNDGHTEPKDQIGKPLGADLEEERLDLRGKSVAEIISILTGPPIGRQDGIDEASSDAVPIAPASPPAVPEPPGLTDAPSVTPRISDAPSMAPGVGGPNLDLPPLKSSEFKGEAVVEDRAPPQTRRRWTATWSRRLSVVAVLVSSLAAIVAVGVTLMTFRDAVRKRSGDISATVTQLIEDASRARAPTKLPRLAIKGQKGLVNEPLPLGVSVDGVAGGNRVILAGLAVGTTLSTGMRLGLTSWEMSARDAGKALVHAPKDFVGTMVAAIDLRSPDDWLIDSGAVRLEWTQRNDRRVAPKLDRPQQRAALHTLDPEETATLFKQFLDQGDVASARLLLRQAANAGDGQAALELGMTFDPVVAVAKWGPVGFAPDVAQAREWYERAVKLGSTQASRYLEQLTRAQSHEQGAPTR